MKLKERLGMPMRTFSRFCAAPNSARANVRPKTKRNSKVAIGLARIVRTETRFFRALFRLSPESRFCDFVLGLNVWLPAFAGITDFGLPFFSSRSNPMKLFNRHITFL